MPCLASPRKLNQNKYQERNAYRAKFKQKYQNFVAGVCCKQGLYKEKIFKFKTNNGALLF